MEQIIHPLAIGDVLLENNLILAPMAGVSDIAFRPLCRQKGAGMTCMEMVSAKALSYRNRNTKELLKVEEGERPVSLQLFGSEPELMGQVAAELRDGPFDVLDLNMGCPVPKVVGNGEGSALMKDPLLAGRILEAMVKNAGRPVTVKIRAGFDEDHKNAPEIAHIAQECGVAAVAVHGRTREQYYSGHADWEIIRKVKEKVSIPVLGNGDLVDGPSVERMAKETGCDGFLVGRAAQGDPWIFKRIHTYFETGEVGEKPAPSEMMDMMLLHARRLIEEKGEHIGVREMRKHAAWYTTGYKNSAALRKEINNATDFETVEALFRRWAEKS